MTPQEHEPVAPGDLSVGSYSAMEYWTKPRPKKKHPIGFAPPVVKKKRKR